MGKRYHCMYWRSAPTGDYLAPLARARTLSGISRCVWYSSQPCAAQMGNGPSGGPVPPARHQLESQLFRPTPPCANMATHLILTGSGLARC